jgi:hypothetical protein
MYLKGEKPSIAYSSVSAHGGECPPEGSVACQPTGKVIQTRPDTNQSYQFFRYDQKNERVIQVITCASPAEVARALNVSGTASFAVAPKAAQSASAAASSATQQTITVVQPADSSSHFAAAASFYNCLNYASGMYRTGAAKGDEAVATEIAKKIFEDAAKMATPAASAAK